MARGILFIVSGPSGAGKSTLGKRAVETFADLRFSISYTTRDLRTGEKDGIDYNFVDELRFEELARKGEFLEHACVHGNWYGTRSSDLREMLESGTDVLLDIDVQGGEQLKKNRLEGAGIAGAVFVFVLPPSLDVCKERLIKRANLSEDELKSRLEIATEEIRKAENYNYIIVNDDLEEAFERLKAIIVAERSSCVLLWDEFKARYGV